MQVPKDIFKGLSLNFATRHSVAEPAFKVIEVLHTLASVFEAQRMVRFYAAELLHITIVSRTFSYS